MKKFIAFLLACVMVLGMTACAPDGATGTKDPSDKTPGNSKPVGDKQEETRPNYDLAYENNQTYWGTTDEIGVPEIPQLIFEEKTVDGITGIVSQTPFQFDRIAVERSMKEHTSFRTLASNIYSFDSESHYGRDTTKNGCYTDQATYSYVMGETEAGDAMFHLYAVKDPRFYNGYSSLHLKSERLPRTENVQELVYDAAKLVFGEYADFLVYGNDSNGVTYGKKPVEVGPLQIIDLVEYEDHTYKLVRTISERGKDQLVVDMFIEVFSNDKYTPHTTLWADETKLFKENAYTPSAIIAGSFGVTDPTNGDFGLWSLSRYINAHHSKLERWSVSEKIYEDSTYHYDFSIKNRYYNLRDDFVGDVWYSVDVEEKDNEVQSLVFDFVCHWDSDDIETDSQEYIDHSISMMQFMFNIDIPAIKYNGKSRNAVKVPLVIDGGEYTAEFSVNHNSGSCGISLIFDIRPR
jgi:hypothetical protein